MSAPSTEQRILRVMRKVLAAVVRDTTPEPGMRHPLSDGTIQDIRACFALISARERELAEEAGLGSERPRFADEPQATRVLKFHKTEKPKKDPKGSA
jgi:hypothetical protein